MSPRKLPDAPPRAALPTLFLDRSLGRIKVPALLRAHGLELVTLAEHYGIPADEDVTDERWLADAGAEGRAVLMKDDRIRYRQVERAALVTSAVRAFCLTSGNLKAAEMAQRFIDDTDRMVAACAAPGPFLYAVQARGIRAIDLDA